MNEYFYTDTIVIGYHGCHIDIKTKLLNGSLEFLPSKKEFDWLGNGIYFWENDYLRAKQWADQYHLENGSIIGAKIKLGICFDISRYSRSSRCSEGHLEV